MNKIVLLWFSVALAGLIQQSCISDKLDFDNLDTKAELNVEGRFPLVKGKVNLKDIVKENDNLIFKEDAEGNELLTIVYSEDSLFGFDVNKIVNIQDVKKSSSFSNFDPIVFEDFVSDSISIGLQALANSANPSVSLTDNTSGVTIPSFSNSSPISGASTFKTFADVSSIVLSEGTFTLYVANKYPFDIENVTIKIINNSGQEIASFFYASIPEGEQRERSIDLKGKTITSGLRIRLERISTPGKSNATIDFDTQKLITWHELTGVKATQGTANLLGHNIQKMDTLDVEINKENSENRVLKYVKFGDANLGYSISTSFTLPFEVVFWSPYLIKDVNGNNKIDIEERNKDTLLYSFLFANQTELSEKFSLEDYIADLTSQGANGNKLSIYYKVRLRVEDGPVFFDIGQDLSADLTLENLNNWIFVQGKFGNANIEIPPYDEDLNISMLDKIDADFRLNDPKVRFPYFNSLGVSFVLDALLKGQKDTKESTLNIDRVIQRPVSLGESVKDTLLIDKNDGLSEFISLPPSKVMFSGNAIVENTSEDHFLVKGGKIKMGMEIEMPLDITVDRLVFSDTTELDIDDVDITRAKLFLKVKNGFPFNSVADVIIRDSKSSGGINLDKLTDIAILKMPEVDEKGKAIMPKDYTRYVVDADEDFLSALSDKADQVIFMVRLKMPSNGAKIYSDYSIDYMISGSGAADIEINSGKK